MQNICTSNETVNLLFYTDNNSAPNPLNKITAIDWTQFHYRYNYELAVTWPTSEHKFAHCGILGHTERTAAVALLRDCPFLISFT